MKLSVMMITYNHEKFIAQAIESALAQKVNFDYDIVIGEDCSTDGTRSIITDFRRRHPDRVVPILRKRNLGVIRNFQETLAACQGRYVAFLEGDDYWTSEQKLQKQVDFLDAHPASAICCHRARFLNETSGEVVDILPSLPARSYTVEDLLKDNFVVACSAVLRRNLIGPFPRWLSRMKMADWPLFAIVATHGNIELMDEVMATYRVHSGGIWSPLSLRTRQREAARMLKAFDRHFRYQYTDSIREAIARPHLEKAITAQVNGDRIETLRNLYACLRNGGWQFRGSRGTMLALAAYAVIGPRYKVFSRNKSTTPS